MKPPTNATVKKVGKIAVATGKSIFVDVILIILLISLLVWVWKYNGFHNATEDV